MHKIFSFFLTVLLSVTFISCGGNDGNPGKNTKTIGVSLLTQGTYFLP